MARLKVRLRGKTVTDVSLAEDRQYVAGRKDEADIVLQAEKGISREHFRVAFQNGEWNVEVISRYGEIQIEGETKQSFTLHHGSLFMVPPYEFEFSQSAAEAPMEVTGAMNLPVKTGEPAGKSDDYANEEKTVLGVAPVSAYVKFVDSHNETKELIRLDAGDSWVAGRDSSCSIMIRDQRVSRRQFEIRKVGNSYHIVELGSVNGTLLNGNPLSSTEPTVLKSGDSISVLDNYLYFELHDPHFRNKMEVVSQQPVASPMSMMQEGLTNEIMPYGGGQNMPDMYQNQMPPPASPLAMPGEKPKFDFQKHRPKIMIGAVLFLVVVYFLKGEDKGPPAPTGKVTAPGSAAEAFSKLKPEQQALVRQRYKDAKNMYMQGKYELAQQEIGKIYEIVPDYEDLKEIERLAKEAIFIQAEKTRQEALEKDRIEAEDKIVKQVAECQKLVNPNITMDKIDDCISPVLQFNPDHPKIVDLKSQVEGLIVLREAKEAERAAYASQVSKLRGLYDKAAGLQQTGKPLDAIAAFEKVIASKLPDPKGLRGQSERNIASIRQEMNTKTASLQTEAEQMYQAQNFKGAILALRKARAIDPDNPELVDKIQRYTMDLRKLMMTLYQEGILEESFGNVEGGESRAGAKEKWKKILEQDISDGEYYKKAYIKLKKYGAL
jgi:pSer/pThr/pTyr-binding forkhead associated (FHA) protein/tetratricopeptide (TPR) repeat protein